MNYVWQPRWKGHFVDMARCRKGVSGARGGGDWQCARKGVVDEGGYLWCSQHAPSAEADRRKAERAKWAAHDALSQQRRDKTKAREKIATVAIEWFNSTATLDDLAAAVRAYEALP